LRMGKKLKFPMWMDAAKIAGNEYDRARMRG
jgi:hypothetical protein